MSGVENERGAIVCPSCGSSEVVPILYGLFCPEPPEILEGKAIPGGCEIFPDQPDRACKRCGHCWQADQRKGKSS